MMKPPDMAQDLYDLYAEFGIAAEKAQLVETEAGNAVLVNFILTIDLDKIAPKHRQAFEALIDEVNRKTLGAVLKIVKSFGTFDESLLQIIDRGLELRNYLTHHFFRNHNFAIHSEIGRTAMIEELKSLQDKLETSHQTLVGITQVLSNLAGVPELTRQQLDELEALGRNRYVR